MAEKPSKSLSTKIWSWLQCVDGHLTPEGLEFVKLCLYAKIAFGSYERIDKPSKLFYHLLKECYDSDEMKTLQVFAHALKRVGNDLRGTHLVEVEMPSHGLECPQPLLERDLSNETYFCLCLVKIGTKARGLLLEDRLKKHFCRPNYLNMNWENIHHLPELFVRLMQRRLLKWNNTVELEKYLNKYAARQCLKYLNQYYKQVGLPILSPDSDSESSPGPCPSGLDVTSDDDPTAYERRRIMQPRQRTTWKLTTISSIPPGMNLNTAPEDVKVSKTSKSHDESDSEQEIDSDTCETLTATLLPSSVDCNQASPQPAVAIVTHPANNATGCKIKLLKCFCLIMILLVATGLVFGALFVTAWLPLIPTKPTSIQGRENSTIILKTVNHFFVEQVDIFEDLVTGHHLVNIYRHNSACENLPTESSIHTEHQLKNITNAYMLQGDWLSYHLTLYKSSNVSLGSVMRVYLVQGLVSDFNPHQVHNEDILHCKNIQFDSLPHTYNFSAKEQGYYSLIFLPSPVPEDIEYDISTTLENTGIAVSQLPFQCNVTSDLDCFVNFTFSFDKSCLVGEILNTNSDDRFLNIGLKYYQLFVPQVLSITIIALLFFIVVFIVLFSCVFVNCFN